MTEETVEVWLYGSLRRHTGEGERAPQAAIHLPSGAITTIGQVFAEVGIQPEQVGNVFVNGRLLPRSNYPILLGYPLAAGSPLSAEDYLNIPVRSGDRVGIFPVNMAAVVV